LIDWYFKQTLAIFQLYRGVIKFYYYMYTPTSSLEENVYNTYKLAS